MTQPFVNGMITAMGKSAAPDRIGGATLIKITALRLFAEHGVDGVSVRQIAEEAGQKNHAALTYHFESKEMLIRELVIDGARRIDERRTGWLNACEAAGGPRCVLDVMDGLVRSSIDPAPAGGIEYYNRFILALQMTNRDIFSDALGNKWNAGYQRCLAHLRRLLPHLQAAVLNRRLVFLGASLGGILAGRERQLADRTRHHAMWTQDATIADIAASLAALVEAPAHQDAAVARRGNTTKAVGR